MIEHALGGSNEVFQRLVIGAVAAVDPFAGFGEVQFAGVNFGAARDDPRDRSQTRGDPWRALVDEAGQRPLEHRRIELIGFAIGVDESARKQGFQQLRAIKGCLGKNFVDETVFRTPDRLLVEARRGQEILGILAPAMGRRKNHRRRLSRRRQDLDRLICIDAGFLVHNPTD